MIIQIKGVIKLNLNADFLILTLIMLKQQPTWNGELAKEQNTMAQGTYSWEHNEQKQACRFNENKPKKHEQKPVNGTKKSQAKPRQ